MAMAGRDKRGQRIALKRELAGLFRAALGPD
jgi:hypothetical protein